MKTCTALLIGVFAVITVAGCSARRGEPLMGARRGGDPQVEHGRLVFMQYCHKCHPGGEAGLGPALNDKPLPEFLIKTQVRVGLGAMPSFGPDIINNQELDDLVRHLKALRGNRS
ncbi:c-type cytochrome [Verrucomicrobiota bacterium sgz303538]